MYSDFKVRNPVHNRAMGIELEGMVTAESDPVEFLKYYSFFSAQRDCSIERDSWGQTTVEFVSQPLSHEWLKREIYKLYKRFPSFKSNSSCGIHVHVSRKWLSEKKAKAIYVFLQSLSEDDRKHLFGRGSNGYCGYSYGYGSTRYCAINNQNGNTIEFRMFKSGDAKWACYCLDMVKYLIDNAYRLNIDAINAFRDMYEV